MKNQVRVLGSLSPYCKNGSNCPGYLFEGNINRILLDCGPGITSLMNMPDDLNNLTIVISHFHKDHYSDLFSLGYASYCYHRMGILDKKIKVYIPEVFPGEPGYEDYLMIISLKEQYFDIRVYNENSKIELEDATISFFKTKHSITNFSSKIESSNNVIVYTGDMGMPENQNFISFCSYASLLISESTYLEADGVNDSYHLNAKEAAQIAFNANVDMLMLTHFWPEHNKTEYLNEACGLFNNTIIAEEGMLLDLNLLHSRICR